MHYEGKYKAWPVSTASILACHKNMPFDNTLRIPSIRKTSIIYIHVYIYIFFKSLTFNNGIFTVNSSILLVIDVLMAIV